MVSHDNKVGVTRGAAISRLRSRAGKTQEQVAAALGVRVQQYGQWERGDTYASARYLFLLARCFGCAVEDVYPELAAAAAELIPEPAAATVGGR